MQNNLNCLLNKRSGPNVNFLQAALRQKKALRKKKHILNNFTDGRKSDNIYIFTFINTIRHF
jgi:hypothetical protein